MVNVTRQGGALLVGLLFSFLIAGAPAASAQTSSLPSGWAHADIGGPVVAGDATSANGSFTVTGAGLDVGGTSGRIPLRLPAHHRRRRYPRAGLDAPERRPRRQGRRDDSRVVARQRAPRLHVRIARTGTRVSTPNSKAGSRQSVQTSGAAHRGSRLAATRTPGHASSAPTAPPTGTTWTLVGSASITMNAATTSGSP